METLIQKMKLKMIMLKERVTKAIWRGDGKSEIDAEIEKGISLNATDK